MNPSDFVSVLRGSAPYVHAHNGSVFVVAFGGEAAERADFEQLIFDIALLHSLGVKLVLVHGVRPQIDARLKAQNLQPQYVGDLRVTDRAALDCVKAAAGSLRMDIEAKLSTSLASTSMGGARIRVAGGNWVTARPVGVRQGVDHLFTGEVRRVDVDSIRRLLDEDRIDRTYLQAALAATRGGVQRVHLVGHDDGALLRELYTRDGMGLMLYSDSEYEATRDASIEDVGGVLALIAPLEQHGVLVARSREQLELEIGHFNVIVRDGLVIACCALFPFTEQASGELACVAVHPDYRRAGRAAALLKRVEAEARDLGLKRLFSLTTHTPHWFIEHGFRQATLEELPAQRQQLYNYQRNSLVLIKDL